MAVMCRARMQPLGTDQGLAAGVVVTTSWAGRTASSGLDTTQTARPSDLPHPFRIGLGLAGSRAQTTQLLEVAHEAQGADLKLGLHAGTDERRPSARVAAPGVGRRRHRPLPCARR